MSSETRELIAWTVTTLVAVCILVGFMVRYVLLPWMREHLVSPMRQVEKQVTENRHSNKEPTVLDRIDDVQKSVDQVATWMDESRADRARLHDALDHTTQRLDLHLGWSHEEVNRLWQAIVTGYDPFGVKGKETGDRNDEETG